MPVKDPTKNVEASPPSFFQSPRDKPASEIKLLRAEIVPKANAPFELVGHDWSPAQPSDSLDPLTASQKLGVSLWQLPSRFQAKYATLQRRFPPQVYDELHADLRPCSEILSDPSNRLNWYWSSGLIPPAFPLGIQFDTGQGFFLPAPQWEQAQLEIMDHLNGISLGD